MQNKNSKAFTLVELIVVIIILAILGTIALISLQGYSSSARNSRRIADINNIKTSLELFNVNSGQYPQPDNEEIVSYGGDELWYQGTIGENVTKNLSKNLNKKPIDPLYEIEYIYSITNTKKEYELLTFYEGNNLTQISPQFSPQVEGIASIISQTNASNTINPKIIGNYNQVYVKSQHYIIPTPSIINAEVNGTGMILNETNIKSQILTSGENLPNVNINGIETQTGNLEIKLSVFTGTINKDSTLEQKRLAIETIQTAYSGTRLGTSGIYQYILSKTSDEEKEGLGDQMLIRKDFKYKTESGGTPTIINGECGSSSGMTLETEPTENLCTSGTSTGMTDGGIGNKFEWTCEGQNGGTSESCSASHVDSFKQISVNGLGPTVCGVTKSGILYCWGYNYYGQIGDETKINKSTPKEIMTGISSVSVGYFHTCAITNLGDLYCWGENNYGQIGDSTNVDKLKPTKINNGEKFSKVSSGEGHTCAITTSGDLKCWGYNNQGQLGDNTFISKNIPTPISNPNLLKFKHINISHNSSCAITNEGNLKCWGSTNNGILPNYVYYTRSVPTDIMSGTLFSDVNIGDNHACAVTNLSDLYCWGQNRTNEIDSSDLTITSPLKILTGVSKVILGDVETCVITTDGYLKCRGGNPYGQFLDGNTSEFTIFKNVFSGVIDADIYRTNCFINTLGDLYCLGYNNQGQIGDGTNVNKDYPVKVNY